MTARSIPTSILFCLALCLAAAVPVFAANPLDVVEAAQNAIQKKYPASNSIARKMALEELEKLARSGKSDDQIIKAILEKFPEAYAEPSIKDDLNLNGIPDDWEREHKVSAGFTAPESDQDADGFTLIQEYKAATEPADPLSHPKYISQICVTAVSRQRFSGLELISIDRNASKYDRGKLGWEVAFSVVRNNRKRTEYVRINSGTFSNNNVSFQVVDIDDQESVVYIQRIGKTERIPCRVRQPIYEPLCRVKLLNTLDDTPIASQVGETFKLGSASVGEEEYRIEFADPDKKIAVVVSVGETKELFSLSFVKDFLPVVSQLPAGSAASAPPADKKP